MNVNVLKFIHHLAEHLGCLPTLNKVKDKIITSSYIVRMDWIVKQNYIKKTRILIVCFIKPFVLLFAQHNNEKSGKIVNKSIDNRTFSKYFRYTGLFKQPGLTTRLAKY